MNKLMTMLAACCLAVAAGGVLAQDAMKKDAMGKGEMKQEMAKDAMKKGEMSRDMSRLEKGKDMTMKKTDTMGKSGGKEKMEKKGAMMKDGMKQ